MQRGSCAGRWYKGGRGIVTAPGRAVAGDEVLLVVKIQRKLTCGRACINSRLRVKAGKMFYRDSLWDNNYKLRLVYSRPPVSWWLTYDNTPQISSLDTISLLYTVTYIIEGSEGNGSLIHESCIQHLKIHQEVKAVFYKLSYDGDDTNFLHQPMHRSHQMSKF